MTDPRTAIDHGVGVGEAFWVRDRVAPTLMWGKTGSGFSSRVDLANYYSLLDPSRGSAATALVDLVSSDGVLTASHTQQLGPRQQLHLDIRELVDEFEGTIAVRLLPEAPPEHPHRYIGTLYFVTWFDAGGHVQFSHEQNRMTFERERPRSFLSPGLRLRPELAVDVIVQSNYFGTADQTTQDAVVTLLDEGGHPLASSTLVMPPRTTRRLSLKDFAPPSDATVAVRVEGSNLNHPFTHIRQQGGDFNIHHF